MNSRVKIAVSVANNGTMKRSGANKMVVDENRRVFLEQHGLSLEKSVLVQLDYDSDNFCRYDVIDETAAGEGIVRGGRIADGLATQTKGLALMLPLADCIGVVLHDPEHAVLMLTHLGRHNLEQNGGQRSVEFMTQKFGTDPATLEVWFSPSAGKENYPLFAFENRSLAEVATEQLLSAGVSGENMTISDVDTTKDERYFSHSEFLKGNRRIDGRIAVITWL